MPASACGGPARAKLSGTAGRAFGYTAHVAFLLPQTKMAWNTCTDCLLARYSAREKYSSRSLFPLYPRESRGRPWRNDRWVGGVQLEDSWILCDGLVGSGTFDCAPTMCQQAGVGRRSAGSVPVSDFRVGAGGLHPRLQGVAFSLETFRKEKRDHGSGVRYQGPSNPMRLAPGRGAVQLC